MIDRVENAVSYDYPKINDSKLHSGASGTGEKFQLDYQEKDKKTEEEGVKLTLSDNGYDKLEASRKHTYESFYQRKETPIKNESIGENSLVKSIRGFVEKVLLAVKDIFQKIWNDSETLPEETNTEKAEEKQYSEFDKLKKDAEDFLNSAEGKKAAKNTDLLTYYDRRGTVISVNASDRQRILYGDKNQIEV